MVRSALPPVGICSKQTQNKQAYPMVTPVPSVKVTSSQSVIEEKTGILRPLFQKKTTQEEDAGKEFCQDHQDWNQICWLRVTLLYSVSVSVKS